MGARLDGTKELIAPAEVLRESAESWADLLRDCNRRRMHDPELVVGDDAMGLWKSPAEELAMVFELVEFAQARWCAVTALHLVALALVPVRAGMTSASRTVTSSNAPRSPPQRDVPQSPAIHDSCSWNSAGDATLLCRA